jgi:glutamate formiminotransferase/glutamate formiminotransferase/formiminotetrahydrofolate cyclodeaminase
MPDQPMLLAVPNVSEGRDAAAVAAIADAFRFGGAQLLDVHSDADHHRSVYTLAGDPGKLAYALLAGVEAALERVDIRSGGGVHPHVGAVDVAPIVHLDERTRGAAAAEALLLADLLGERSRLPVFLYGVLGGGRTRAELRRGGPRALAERVSAGELQPDFGPSRLHPAVGATLVAARPPLVAFNVELAPPAGVAEARAIAARLREGGSDGLRGVRAIGVELTRSRQTVEHHDRRSEGSTRRGQPGDSTPNRDPPRQVQPRQPRSDSSSPVGQVSLNVEDSLSVSLAEVLAAIEVLAAELGARVAVAELVGLAPAAAVAGVPERVPLIGFDPDRHVIERVLALARTRPTG